MNATSRALSSLSTHSIRSLQSPAIPKVQRYICTQCTRRIELQWTSKSRLARPAQRRHASTQPADEPGFTSIVDHAPVPVRVNRKRSKFGLAILVAIPAISFGLGCWQVQRLGWKTELMAKFEDRLIRDPLPLPPRIDPDAIKEFDYRRVYAKGVLRHDQEMLIGPRLHDGNDGYLVITPLDRSEEFPKAGNTKILVNRGWIPKAKADQKTRPEGLPQGSVVVEGLLREPWKKNSFTPDNKPEKGIFHFPDVHEMAEHTGSQPVWIEETMAQDLLLAYHREDKGIPIGRAAEVNLRNNHAQYIFTWFSLSAATSVMLWMVLKKPTSGVQRRVRQNRSW